MNTTAKFINQLEMVGFLKTNGTQCRFVSLISETPVVKIRKDCPFKNVKKVSQKLGIINANYNTSVRRNIAENLGVELKEVEYENGEVWYTHLMTPENKPLPVVVNKRTPDNGKYYVQFFPQKSSHVYVGENGEVISEETLKPYFYKESERPDYKPCVISIELTNVKEFRASGVIIEMPGLEEIEKILAQA